MDRAARLASTVRGTVLFVGASDTGKTTLAQAVLAELESKGRAVAYLDCDLGQTTVGPPTTMGVRWRGPDGQPETHLYFVGDTSPRRHFLPVIVGASTLLEIAHNAGNDTVLVDTSGLVDPAAGGVALKLWKSEALRADYFVALQREDELRPILNGVRRRLRGRLIVLDPGPDVRRRERRERTDYRRERWAQYFAHARQVSLRLAHLDVWGGYRLEPSRLVGLDDAQGLCLGLGVLMEAQGGAIRVLTPVEDVDAAVRLRLGSLLLDPDWRETRYP
ncbi:MAG: Clp1/GlmU family protein [Anaerolineae bacterium]